MSVKPVSVSDCVRIFKEVFRDFPDPLVNFDVDAVMRQAAVNLGIPRDSMRYPAPWERELRAKRRAAALLGWRRRRAAA